MDEASTWQWASGMALVVGAAFFAAADAALGVLGEVRARQLVDSGGARGKLLGTWVTHPERVNAVVIVGSVLTSAGTGALLALRGGVAGSALAATLSATGLLILFGQILPRGIGKRYPVRIALAAMPVIRALAWLLWPLLAVVERASRFLTARIGAGEEPPAVTSDEIEYLIEVGTREGGLDAVRQELLSSVLEFADRVVKEIMVPRTRMAALEREAPPDQLVRVVTENPYSRMPVYQGSVDNIVGVLLLRDLVPELARGTRAVSIEKYLKPPYFVPEQMKISRLLKEMQRRKVHLAVVVDEFGGTSGLVTLEDVIEEIVGEIQDEADTEAAPVRTLGDGTFLADASISLHDLEDFLNGQVELPELEVRFPEDGDYETLGGFVTAIAGRVPAVGAQVEWDGLDFTVRAGDERRVAKVEIARRALADEVAPRRAAERRA